LEWGKRKKLLGNAKGEEREVEPQLYTEQIITCRIIYAKGEKRTEEQLKQNKGEEELKKRKGGGQQGGRQCLWSKMWMDMGTRETKGHHLLKEG